MVSTTSESRDVVLYSELWSAASRGTLFQDRHSSQKSWKHPGILFCPGNVLEDDPFLAEGPGKSLNFHIKDSKFIN